MRRIIAFALIMVLVLAVAFSDAEGKHFIDTESGVSFEVPTGWEEVPNVDNNESVKIQYTPSTSVGQTTVALAVLDLYSAVNLSQYGVTRKEIDFSFLDDDLITTMLGPLEAKSNTVKQYGNYKYKVITTTLERTKAGLKFFFNCEMMITLVNGYVIVFQYLEMNHSEEYHTVLESILSSVQIKQ